MTLRARLRMGVGIVVVLLLTSLFFSFLYRYDNKYTQQTTQAVNGLLILSQEDLEVHPIRYLYYGWRFYPDQLLYPEDFTNAQTPLYYYETMIGQETRFDRLGTRNTPHGSGTYAMTLQLPEEEQMYALALPEIFSAYRLYVNGKLLLQMGNPDPQQYQDCVQNRIVTFAAARQVTLLLAVSDFSHYYSGMVYPPAFGTPYTLNLYRGFSVCASFAFMLTAFWVAVLSFYFGYFAKHQNALLFGILCFMVCGFTAYPALHSIFALSIFPWYPLELLSMYLMLWLVIVLQNRICAVSGWQALCSNAVAAGFCIFAGCYGIGAAHLTVPIMRVFSSSVTIIKAAAAVYLLVISYRALRTRDKETKPLFYSGIAYASALVWDRLLPQFEPIVGGWFSEWGGMLMVLAIGYLLWRDLVQAYTAGLAFAEQNRQMTRQLSMQMEYSRQIMQQAAEKRRFVHDMRQHLRAIQGMAVQTGQQDIIAYITSITQGASHAQTGIIFCNNIAVNALLQYYYGIAGKHGFAMDIKFDVPDNLPLTDVECCTILGNLLENAVEACQRQTGGKHVISLKSYDKGNTFYLLLENTYNGKLRKRGGHFLSSKSSGERIGVGLESIREVILEHGGTMDCYALPERFQIGISLPL